MGVLLTLARERGQHLILSGRLSLLGWVVWGDLSGLPAALLTGPR
jgi:hypothetical protein